ncbi:conserved hypothetical protein [Culex quinquefasciatus]|uniref:Uncharacterized protein n=1 Tax=Culex quinquefasciatus TaxID=7176 RepID=B0XD31_CULQU|nr:conserved hypothetical protein [Culex quinquefasciatus]|eukprot:XP_001867553.1 conserved hypothetical protein [Culex quinquefasciatus]
MRLARFGRTARVGQVDHEDTQDGSLYRTSLAVHHGEYELAQTTRDLLDMELTAMAGGMRDGGKRRKTKLTTTCVSRATRKASKHDPNVYKAQQYPHQLVADSARINSIIDRERQELVDGMDCPENIFVQPLEQLTERREKVASKKITEPSSEPAAPLDEQAEPITESPEPTLTADVGQPLQDSNFLQSVIVQTLHCETSDYFYFFQATEGHLHSQFHKRVQTVNQAAGSKADSCNWLENIHCAVCGTADTVRSRLSTPKRS